jgi:hypothetical protein
MLFNQGLYAAYVTRWAAGGVCYGQGAAWTPTLQCINGMLHIPCGRHSMALLHHSTLPAPLAICVERTSLRCDRRECAAQAISGYTIKRFVPFNPVDKKTLAEVVTPDGQQLTYAKGAPQVGAVPPPAD